MRLHHFQGNLHFIKSYLSLCGSHFLLFIFYLSNIHSFSDYSRKPSSCQTEEDCDNAEGSQPISCQTEEEDCDNAEGSQPISCQTEEEDCDNAEGSQPSSCQTEEERKTTN